MLISANIIVCGIIIAQTFPATNKLFIHITKYFAGTNTVIILINQGIEDISNIIPENITAGNNATELAAIDAKNWFFDKADIINPWPNDVIIKKLEHIINATKDPLKGVLNNPTQSAKQSKVEIIAKQ